VASTKHACYLRGERDGASRKVPTGKPSSYNRDLSISPLAAIFQVSVTNKVISMKTLILKSFLTSLFQREVLFPSLAKRGKGRFSNNVALLLHFLVIAKKNPYPGRIDCLSSRFQNYRKQGIDRECRYSH